MRRGGAKRRIGGTAWIAGTLCGAVLAVSSAVYANLGQPAEGISGGSVTMLDPFALEVISISRMPSSPQDTSFSSSVEVDLEHTIRIPDRPVVRSVFQPSP